jgi:hypothetical protein
MLNAALLVLLAVVLIYPAYLLRRQAYRFTWRARYLLAALPAAYTGLGWQVAALSYEWVGCQGNMKGLYACTLGGADVTPLVGYGFFLTIPFFFVALPLSLWLLLDTAAKQIGEWRQRQP